MRSPLDLTGLLTTADPRAPQAERHLWLVQLLQWLRQSGPAQPPGQPLAEPAAQPPGAALEPAIAPEAPTQPQRERTPLPVLRLRYLLNALDRQPEPRQRVQALLHAFWREIDAPALLADLGFGARQSLGSEVLQRVQRRLLPATPDTRDLAALFGLLFHERDAAWVDAIDAPTLARAMALLAPPGEAAARGLLLEAITILVSAIHSSGYAPALRQRMDPKVLDGAPFRQLVRSADTLRSALLAGTEAGHAQALREAVYLRGVLAACRAAADSVTAHLEAYGVSVDIVYELDQLQARTARVELLLGCLLAPDAETAARETRHLLVQLLHTLGETTGLRALLAQHYSLLARQVAERNAETGSHYITRNRGEYRTMLRMAAGGGLVIAGTTWLKFMVVALGMTAFWTGFWAGVNYAASFVLVMLLHWTVATKQPAMTAPALAQTLPVGSAPTDLEVETFVDRVAQLIRSQVAAVIGNVAVCAPLVLATALLAQALLGRPLLVDEAKAAYVLHNLTLLGPTVLFAAFTGVLLFASSLVAGWAENWFVFHRLDSAIAWNPRIVARLGPARAQRWAAWWRRNISGLAANISLGMMLGLVPALLGFLGIGLQVRHVTLASGELAAALGTLGFGALAMAAFWWCVAGIVAIGVLNISVSFWLAFKVALRSRGVRVRDRSRIGAALRQRLRRDPLSFLRPPPRDGIDPGGPAGAQTAP